MGNWNLRSKIQCQPSLRVGLLRHNYSFRLTLCTIYNISQKHNSSIFSFSLFIFAFISFNLNHILSSWKYLEKKTWKFWLNTKIHINKAKMILKMPTLAFSFSHKDSIKPTLGESNSSAPMQWKKPKNYP